jgi:hypothetical protein
MSSHAAFYVQQCPTCGRRLRICVEYLGKSIQCRHCRAIFTARDPDNGVPEDDPRVLVLQRVDELIGPLEPVSYSHTR